MFDEIPKADSTARLHGMNIVPIMIAKRDEYAAPSRMSCPYALVPYAYDKKDIATA
jgi:hypothetical protein